MNGRCVHTTSVCVSLRWSGGLYVIQLPAGSWHMKCIVSCASTSFPCMLVTHGPLWQWKSVFAKFCTNSIKVIRDPKQRSVMVPISRNGMKGPPQQVVFFSGGLWSALFQADAWKCWKYGSERCHFDHVCDITDVICQAFVVAVYISSHASLSLFFIGRDRTNTAVPWEAQTWSRKWLLLHKYW